MLSLDNKHHSLTRSQPISQLGPHHHFFCSRRPFFIVQIPSELLFLVFIQTRNCPALTTNTLTIRMKNVIDANNKLAGMKWAQLSSEQSCIFAKAEVSYPTFCIGAKKKKKDQEYKNGKPHRSTSLSYFLPRITTFSHGSRRKVQDARQEIQKRTLIFKYVELMANKLTRTTYIPSTTWSVYGKIAGIRARSKEIPLPASRPNPFTATVSHRLHDGGP